MTLSLPLARVAPPPSLLPCSSPLGPQPSALTPQRPGQALPPRATNPLSSPSPLNFHISTPQPPRPAPALIIITARFPHLRPPAASPCTCSHPHNPSIFTPPGRPGPTPAPILITIHRRADSGCGYTCSHPHHSLPLGRAGKRRRPPISKRPSSPEATLSPCVLRENRAAGLWMKPALANTPLPLQQPALGQLNQRGRSIDKSRQRRAYAQQLVTTRLLDCLHDPVAQLSRLQRIYPYAL